MLKQKRIKIWHLTLSYFVSCGLTFKLAQKIINRFKDPNVFLNSAPEELLSLDFLPRAIKKNIIENKKNINIMKLQNKLKTLKIGFISYEDKNYPNLLKEIDQPPLGLFYKGNPKILKNISLAIVGTRKPTSYGIEVTRYFVRQLILYNFTITSGLAIGIDGIAQNEAIKNNGTTIGVLGCGLDIIYPKTNHQLAQEIINSQKGVLISEFPPGTPPFQHHFPMRNRIISGLSVGTLIIEGGSRSGSLITGNYALQQNREVFAIPGSIFSNRSKTPHYLIKQGAKLTENIEDILKELSIKPKLTLFAITKQQDKNLPSRELSVYNLIKNNGQISINKLVKQLKIDIKELLKILTNLELKNLIKEIGNKEYAIFK